MLLMNDKDELPPGKIRNAVYTGLQYGPIKDMESVRENHIIEASDITASHKDFKELCSSNSILRNMN
jgi:hypothetical protein